MRRNLLLAGLLVLWTALNWWITLSPLGRELGLKLSMRLLLNVVFYLWVAALAGCFDIAAAVLFGFVAGTMLEPAVQGGTTESQVWASVQRQFLGAAAGLIAGILFRLGRSRRNGTQRPFGPADKSSGAAGR
jgi:hypothetical protein